MRVLITTEFYLPFQCGVTTAVLNERKCLEALGHEVRILTIADSKKSYFKDGVYYMRSNLPKMYQDSYATLAFNDPLIKDIYSWSPEIVHSQCEFFTMVYAKKVARKLHIPLVHTCHTDFDEYGVHFTKSTRLWAWATSTFIPKLLRKADYIICPTNKIYYLLARYGTRNEMEIIPCGMDLAKLQSKLDSNERVALRKEFGFSPDDVVFVSVCRLSKEKNVSESIDHFVSLNSDRTGLKLLIVGDGAERQNLEQKADASGFSDSIRFAGNVPMDIVWKYFKVGDIFISSSVSEIQGLTYIEALACGIPVILSDIPVHKELRNCVSQKDNLFFVRHPICTPEHHYIFDYRNIGVSFDSIKTLYEKAFRELYANKDKLYSNEQIAQRKKYASNFTASGLYRKHNIVLHPKHIILHSKPHIDVDTETFYMSERLYHKYANLGFVATAHNIFCDPKNTEYPEEKCPEFQTIEKCALHSQSIWLKNYKQNVKIAILRSRWMVKFLEIAEKYQISYLPYFIYKIFKIFILLKGGRH